MFVLFSNRLGCVGSIIASAFGTLVLILAMRACQANQDHLPEERGTSGLGAPEAEDVSTRRPEASRRVPENEP